MALPTSYTTMQNLKCIPMLFPTSSARKPFSRTLTMTFIVMTLFAALSLPLQLSAQHTRYKFIDIPTLGGPAAIGQVDGLGISQFINDSGVVVGGADTTAPDPFCLNPGCFLVHAFRWQDGVVTDLGSLPGVSATQPRSIHAAGPLEGHSLRNSIP
jgi:probable HAF family extracellular repeat protein